ncbi:hypothetical protein B566_EDAN017856 [Ephemera danica]|nr:hypothetical protein B566_EDAN017856 [Ephemera danica]
MLPSSPLAGPPVPHRFYSMPRAPSYQATSAAIPQHNRAMSPPAARDPTSPMYDSRATSPQYFSTASSPPPPAPYYWTLPSRRTTMEAPAQQVQQSVAPQPSWYHTIASHNNPAPPPYSPHRHLDTNHNVLQNQMFSTPTKNHVPQMPYCTYSPIGSPKKNLDRPCSSASPLASPSRAQSPKQPLMSPPKSTMSAEELFAAIHRSKRRMNIKSADDFSRSTSPTTSSASLSPGSSESSLGAVGNRHSWSPGTNDILPDLAKSKEQGSPVRGQAGQRQSWAGDRLGPVQPTSRNVFKRLLLEKGSRSEGKGRVSAVEQLMASKAVVSKPKEQKVTLPAMPSGLRSPASWRFNSPRSDVLSSTILEDTEDASSESPTHSPSSLQQRMSPRHNAIYTPKAPLSSPKTARYNLTPAQASDFAARSADYQKHLKYDVDRLAPSSKEIPSSYSNISSFKNEPLNHHDNASPQSQHKSSPSRLNKSENQRQNNIVTSQTPPSPSKLSLETAL